MRAHGAAPRSPLVLATLSLASVLALSSALGCSQSAPTAPTPTAVAASPVASATSVSGSAAGGTSVGSSSLAASSASHSVDLSGGTFRVTTTSSDQLTGTYTGRATVPQSRPATVTFDLRVTGGSGAFQGASGTLRGDGTGAFAGEGTFSLSLKGPLSLAGKPGSSNVQTDISGTARTSCVGGRIQVTLQGSGSSNRFGNVTETLTHVLGNAACS